jgi:hypothetical protein
VYLALDFERALFLSLFGFSKQLEISWGPTAHHQTLILL